MALCSMSAQGSTHIETRRAAALHLHLHLHLPVQLKTSSVLCLNARSPMETISENTSLRTEMFGLKCSLCNHWSYKEHWTNKKQAPQSPQDAKGVFCLTFPFTYRSVKQLEDGAMVTREPWRPAASDQSLALSLTSFCSWSTQALASTSTAPKYSGDNNTNSGGCEANMFNPHRMHFVFTWCSLSIVRGDTHSLHLCRPLTIHTSLSDPHMADRLEEYLLGQLLTFPNAAPLIWGPNHRIMCVATS